jgi:C4-dicarboxylate-specific signal transduction histidine kinase
MSTCDGRREPVGRISGRDTFFTTKPDGLGLGLTISRTIVEAYRGRLFVANDPAGGAIFRVHLRTEQSRTT